MDKRREAEYDRLTEDHPGWTNLPYNKIRSRYWMYFRDDVTMARTAAYWRRAKTPLVRFVDWLNRKLGGGR